MNNAILMSSLLAMQRMIGVLAVVNLSAALFASLFCGFSQLTLGTLLVLLQVLVYLSLDNVAFEE